MSAIIVSRTIALHIYDKCVKLYEIAGPTEVYDYCNRFPTLVSYKRCEPCEARTPQVSYVHNTPLKTQTEISICCVCGAVTTNKDNPEQT